MIKMYVKENCNLVFGVKDGSDLTGLTEIDKKDVREFVKSKGLTWLEDYFTDSEELFLYFDFDSYTDERILCNLDLKHSSYLSEDCMEVVTL